MYPMADIITSLFNKNGVYSDAHNVKSVVLGEIYAQAEQALTSHNVFSRAENGMTELKLFLLAAEVGQI